MYQREGLVFNTRLTQMPPYGDRDRSHRPNELGPRRRSSFRGVGTGGLVEKILNQPLELGMIAVAHRRDELPLLVNHEECRKADDAVTLARDARPLWIAVGRFVGIRAVEQDAKGRSSPFQKAFRAKAIRRS